MPFGRWLTPCAPGNGWRGRTPRRESATREGAAGPQWHACRDLQISCSTKDIAVETTSTYVIKTEALTKTYQGVSALQDLSLTVPRHSIPVE